MGGDGTVLATRLLVHEQVPTLNLYDVNNAGLMAGVSYQDGVQASFIAWLDAQHTLQVEYLPNPDPNTIRYFRKMQLDDAGNVVGYGAEPTGTGTEYPRAVVWPVTGPVVSLSTLTSGYSTMGEGIASVNGVMQVVGSGFTNAAGWYASLYTNGKYSDLNQVSKGTSTWTLWAADGVNAAGWICGRGRIKVAKTTATC